LAADIFFRSCVSDWNLKRLSAAFGAARPTSCATMGKVMTSLTRRTFVNGGTALVAAGALTGPALLEWARAWGARYGS
jgi:hypothetical protein